MGCNGNNNHHHHLHIFFVPLLAKGHIIPLLDAARLFAERGVRATIVTTPANADLVLPTLDKAAGAGISIQLLLIPFPSAAVGLPAGSENTASFPRIDDVFPQFYQGMQLLRDPLLRLVRAHRPDCIVSDSTLNFPTHVAADFGIPHVQFSVFSAFSVSLVENIRASGAHLADGDVVGPLKGLPHGLVVRRAEMPTLLSNMKMFDLVDEARRKSLGVMFNSFHELDPDYADLCQMGGRRKVWCVGPVRLHDATGGSDRDWEKWEGMKRWLDEKEVGSVLYISFGSECCFPDTNQLREMALGFETSGHPFIWVVRSDSDGGGAGTMEEWLPKGFEERVRGRGMILTEWAPQVSIINHPSVGAFLLHCGWNSSIEAVTAGLPVIAWPLHTEQFLNEMLMVDVLRIGVRVFEGAKRTLTLEEREIMKGEAISEAVCRLLGGGEEGRVMRERAKEYRELARLAMEEGGSSHANISFVIEEIGRLAEERREERREREVGEVVDENGAS